jgi:hypothetical protein
MSEPTELVLAERAAIVRYLRETAELHDENKSVPGLKVVSRHHADACRWAAECIEGGHHHLPKPK